MNLKRITHKLSKIRDNTRENGSLSEEDVMLLKDLLGDTIALAHEDLKNLPKNISPYLPTPHNDNSCLTTEQKFRLRLMEKTGTGSISIH